MIHWIRSTAKGVGFLLLPLSMLCAGPASAQQAEPIRVGALLDMTGGFADFGLKFKAGIEFRLEEAKWSAAGRKVELIIADAASQSPTVALDQAKKLVESDKVHVVIGPLTSGPRLAVEPYLAQRRVPTLTLSSHTIAAKRFGWTVFTRGTLWQVPYPLGVYAAEELGVKTVTTIGSDFVAGREYIAAFADGLTQKGGTVVQQQWSPIGTPDFGPYLVGLKEADAVALMLAGTDPLRFLKQYAEFGLHKKKTRILLPTLATLEDSRLQELGEITLGIIGADDYAKQQDTPANKSFIAAFEAKTKKRSDKHEAAAYETTSVVLQALEVTKGDTNPEKLRQAMFGVKMETPSGHLAFTPSGIGIRDVYILEVKKIGDQYAWVPIKTVPQVRHPGE
jgi:branched-chain amino acid transport system substrate-binding protein